MSNSAASRILNGAKMTQTQLDRIEAKIDRIDQRTLEHSPTVVEEAERITDAEMGQSDAYGDTPPYRRKSGTN
jgi:hypothetical protein